MNKLCGLQLGFKFWSYTAFTVLLYGLMWRYYICFIHIRGLTGLTSVVHQRPAAPLSDLHFQWKHSDGTSNYFYDNILKKKIPKPSLNSDLTINYLLKKHIYENENEKFGCEWIDNRRLRRNEKWISDFCIWIKILIL